MAQKILRLRITGRVQGVSFRGFVANEAGRRGLKGWVRNRSDGSVEAVIAGDDTVVAEMIEMCRRGPAGARVDNVATDEANESDLGTRTGFEILRRA
ncbi:MAG: acylphosphatase [Methylobacteriaceae bacterium]|nr:acylphosphatase [Methylobacteriaceae bacterium]